MEVMTIKLLTNYSFKLISFPFNRLTDVIQAYLLQLQRAIKGLEVMSNQLEEVGHSLLSGKIPPEWMKRSYPSLKPLSSYISDLVKRIQFFQVWFAHLRCLGVINSMEYTLYQYQND